MPEWDRGFGRKQVDLRTMSSWQRSVDGCVVCGLFDVNDNECRAIIVCRVLGGQRAL